MSIVSCPDYSAHIPRQKAQTGQCDGLTSWLVKAGLGLARFKIIPAIQITQSALLSLVAYFGLGRRGSETPNILVYSLIRVGLSSAIGAGTFLSKTDASLEGFSPDVQEFLEEEEYTQVKAPRL